MKILNLSILLFLAFVTFNLCAQTPKQIEDDLLKSFKRIDYWDEYRGSNKDKADDLMKANDSLNKACNIFGEKLKSYTSNYPFTIEISLNSSKAE